MKMSTEKSSLVEFSVERVNQLRFVHSMKILADMGGLKISKRAFDIYLKKNR